MDIKKTVEDSKDIRCFNIVSNESDKRFGLECGRLLLKKNSLGNVAGEIKCNRCNAIYDIKDKNIILIERSK